MLECKSDLVLTVSLLCIGLGGDTVLFIEEFCRLKNGWMLEVLFLDSDRR